MSLKTQMANDVPIFINTDEFAESVTYAGSSIDAIWIPGNDPKEESHSLVSKGMLIVKVSDVASPGYRDAVIIGSTTWYMRMIIKSNDNVHTLQLETDERPKLA